MPVISTTEAADRYLMEALRLYANICVGCRDLPSVVGAHDRINELFHSPESDAWETGLSRRCWMLMARIWMGCLSEKHKRE